MRSKLFLAGFTLAIGCGGGGGKKAMIVDAMVDSPTIDAAPACSVTCDNAAFCNGANLNTGNFPALRLGGNNTCSVTTTTTCTMNTQCPTGETCRLPATGDWFITFTQGDLNGRKAFDIFVTTSAQGANPIDIVGVRLLKPTAGNFPLNAAQNFETNPNTAVPNAWSFYLGDADIQNNMIANVAQEYWGTMGSLTLTAIGEVDGAKITGTTSAITWSEIDDMGMVVAGGCTATMGVMPAAQNGFTFSLQQMATAFQSNGSIDLGDGYRTLTPEELTAAKAYMNKRFPQVTGQQL